MPMLVISGAVGGALDSASSSVAGGRVVMASSILVGATAGALPGGAHILGGKVFPCSRVDTWRAGPAVASVVGVADAGLGFFSGQSERKC